MDNHHRRSISALILLSFLAVIIAHEYTLTPLQQLDQTTDVPFAGLIPEVISKGSDKGRQIILTFDGGEGNQSINEILSALESHNAHATFFLTGKWMESNPQATKKIILSGHDVFNHSYSHPHFPLISDEQIALQLQQTDDVFKKIASKTTKPYFRPPYGDYDKRVLAAAAKSGYRAVMWSLDAGDWMESQGFTDAEAKARIYAGIYPGSIILMHIGDTITGRILEQVLTEIEKQGYKVVTLSQGLL